MKLFHKTAYTYDVHHVHHPCTSILRESTLNKKTASLAPPKAMGAQYFVLEALNLVPTTLACIWYTLVYTYTIVWHPFVVHVY